MIRTIVSASIKTALSIVVFLILLLAFFIALLQTGLDFENVDIGGVKIRQLYLKIDKKLILEADELILPADTAPAEPGRIVKQLRRGFLALYFIERIHIKQIQTPKGPVGIHYKKGLFTVTHERGEAVAQLGWMDPGIAFELKTLTYADANLTAEGRGFFNPLTGWFFADAGYASSALSGSLNVWGDTQSASLRFGRNRFSAGGIEGGFHGTAEIDLKTNEWRFEGDIQALSIEGELHLVSQGGKTRASLLNATAKTLGPLAEFLPIGEAYRPWVYGFITAEHYEAKEFSLDIDLLGGGALYDTIYLDAFALGGSIRFHPDLEAADAPRIEVSIANDALHIFTREGTFSTQPADAYFNIEHLSSNQTRMMTLQINTPALFDESIRTLLATYGASVEVDQSSGENDTFFELTADLSTHGHGVSTYASGTARNAETVLYGIPLYMDELSLEVKGDQIAIRDANLTLPDLGTLNASGTIDAAGRHFDLQAQVGHITLLDGLAVDMTGAQTTVWGEWDAVSFTMGLPGFGTAVHAENDQIILTVSDLSLLKPHVPLMDLLGLTGGDLKLTHAQGRTTADFNIQFNNPVLFTGNTPVTQTRGRLERENGSFLLSLLEGRVLIEKDANLIRGKINRLEVDAGVIEAFVKQHKNRFAFGSPKPGSDAETRYFIFGNQTAIRYRNQRLGTEWFSLHIDGDRLDGQIKQGNSALAISRNKSDVTLRGEKIGTAWVKDLTGMNMTGGTWDLTAYANLNNEDLYGVIRINKATFKEARLLTNVIALINTLPSLVQFRTPGFTAEGFTIERGVVEFYYASDTLFLNAIRLIGTNTDIIGQGSINLKSGEVNIYASIQSVKAASSLIGRIPILGYLLLGDDKAISNVLHITGTLDKPEVKSEVAQEIVFYPLNVIARTLTLPLKLFEPSE